MAELHLSGNNVSSMVLSVGLLTLTGAIMCLMCCKTCLRASAGPRAWFDSPLSSSTTSLSSAWRRSPSPTPEDPHPSPETSPSPPPPRHPPVVCQHPGKGDVCLAVYDGSRGTADRGACEAQEARGARRVPTGR